MTRISEAYQLAQELRPAFKRRIDGIVDRLEGAGCRTFINGVADFASVHRMLVITMNLGECVQMLKDGAWLNMYEVESRHKAGEESRKDGTWEPRRAHVERLLRFGKDAHYASLAFGGTPEPRFGDDTACCVVLDLNHWLSRATAYAGDSLRACFDEAGHPEPDERILQLFAIATDWWSLILLRHEDYFMDSRDKSPGIDPRDIRTTLEDPDTMIEMHLHGPVTIEQVRTVIVPRALRDRCVRKYKKWEAPNSSRSHDMADAPKWQALISELNRVGMEPTIGEDK